MSIFSSRRSPLFSPLAAGVVLIAFYAGMLASLREKSQTMDEGVHLAGGFTYWRFNDYRIHPENGNLPQRVAALPLLLGNIKPPATDDKLWRTSDKWRLSWQWLYQLGNDAEAMIQRGRAASGLLAVVLGVLVWACARQLFGPIGGMISLLLYVLDPSILANGALTTSDMACALFFFAATWSWWRVLQQIAIARVIINALAVAALFLSKMSAVLIVPIGLILLVARLIDGRSLPVRALSKCELRSRGAQFFAFLGSAIASGVLVLAIIWGFYGFRYAAFSPAMAEGSWDDPWESLLDKPAPKALFERLGLGQLQSEEVSRVFIREKAEQKIWASNSIKAVEAVKREALTEEQAAHLDQLLAEPSPRLVARVTETLRHYHLLPEAYIYGFVHAWHFSRGRASFFNGDFSISGWRTFFPYTFLVKTPLTIFVVMALAIAAAIGQWSKRAFAARSFFSALYDTLPLWVLLGVYWVAAISSHLTIGHRHILPTYPPLFVLCGAAAWWFNGPNEARTHRRSFLAVAAPVGLCVAIALLALEVVYSFPNYLAYFNGIVRPARAYRHLVDSSLDWGQDLPAVRRYIETRHPATPVYLSYFGSASPVYYGVPAIHIHSFFDWHRSPPLQILALSPHEESDMLLRDFLRGQPEYDDKVFRTEQQGDKVLAVVVKNPAALRLTAGTYFISATMLQPITQPGSGAFGPWNARLEKEYQSFRRVMAPLLSDDPVERNAALTQFTPETWLDQINSFERLRFHRLAAFLRPREPDDNVDFSILMYRVSDDDISRALEGPPPELHRDLSKELFGGQP